MSEIEDYIVIAGCNSGQLSVRVMAEVKKGFVPLGGVAESQTNHRDHRLSVSLSQAMVKYKDGSND